MSTNNPWTAFLNLLPSEDQWMGRIESISASTGKVTVSLPGGTVTGIVVNGDDSYTIGDYVWIKSNVIQSKAPDLKTPIADGSVN